MVDQCRRRRVVLLAVIFGAAIGAISDTRAQPSTDNRLLFDERGVQLERPAPPQVQQAPVRRNATSNVGTAPADPRITRPRIKERSPPPPEQRFGRVSVDDASIGLETNKKLKTDQLPDGGKIPAIESMRKDQVSPFVGFSLSVPNSILSGSNRSQ
jgi:hypothetical protein